MLIVPFKKTLAIVVICSLLISCTASITSKQLRNVKIASTNSFYVQFEFDRIGLADEFNKHFKNGGINLVSSVNEADFFLTGSYSASHDVFHYRMDWAQFKLIDAKDNQTIYTIQCGQSGLESAESVAEAMAHEILNFITHSRVFQ